MKFDELGVQYLDYLCPEFDALRGDSQSISQYRSIIENARLSVLEEVNLFHGEKTKGASDEQRRRAEKLESRYLELLRYLDMVLLKDEGEG